MDIKQSTRKCSKCGKVKLLDEFSKDKYHKDGKCSRCKKCIAEYSKENRKKIWKQQKEYRRKNWEEYLAKCRIYWRNNKEKITKGKRRRYRENNYLEYFRKYYRLNKEKVLKYRRQYDKNRNKLDLKYNLNHRISEVIRQSLKGNKVGRHWEDLAGYTLKDLIKRLKHTMPEGYNWNDYLKGKLEIDHIIPKSVFNFTKPEHTDFKRCWALSNLRLLPKRENRIKHNKLTKPFQPALVI